MILEALVSTVDADGTPHLAPMGPRVTPGSSRFVLRPFPTSRTYRNLRRTGEGVLHVTDDALLVAKAALGAVRPFPAYKMAEKVHGVVLTDACRHVEFAVRSVDDSGERVTLACEAVHEGRGPDFFGFNRAKHAVLEAAIVATRFHLMPDLADAAAEFRRFRVIVAKTGGPGEHEAMDLLDAALAAAAAARRAAAAPPAGASP